MFRIDMEGKAVNFNQLTPNFQFYIMSHWIILILTHFLLGFWCSPHLPFSESRRRSQDPLIGTNPIKKNTFLVKFSSN